MARKSIHVKEFAHKNPIPAACRIGNLVFSGGIHGMDPATGAIAEGFERQCALMFEHVARVVTAAGGSPADIAKMTFWMSDKSLRPKLNTEWLKMFPDEHSRPARHTMQGQLDGGMLVQCDFVAVLS